MNCPSRDQSVGDRLSGPIDEDLVVARPIDRFHEQRQLSRATSVRGERNPTAVWRPFRSQSKAGSNVSRLGTPRFMSSSQISLVPSVRDDMPGGCRPETERHDMSWPIRIRPPSRAAYLTGRTTRMRAGRSMVLLDTRLRHSRRRRHGDFLVADDDVFRDRRRVPCRAPLVPDRKAARRGSPAHEQQIAGRM